MDSLWIAATGARAVLQRQDVVTNNLANASTTGYRAATPQFRALPVYGEPLPSNAYVATQSESTDFQQGSMIHTGRNLDVAVQGPG
jgi:flagellar basal-body rod protein FlgF